MENILRVQHAIHQLYNDWNVELWQGALPECVVILSDDRKGKTYGHCTVDKVWNDDGVMKYEIAVTAQFLDRDIADICGTIIHEQVHLMNIAKGINDCNPKTQRHNKKFKKLAEEVGLIVEKDDRRGFAITKMSPELIATMETFEIDRDAFVICKMKPLPKEEVEKKPSQSNTYFCTECNISFKSKKELDLICGICKNPYEVERPEDLDEIEG